MKDFLCRAGWFFLIQLSLLSAIVSWFRGDLVALSRIRAYHGEATTAKGPRLLICGGSSTPVSFDVAAIAEATGRDVIDTGLNGALGLEFVLRQAAALSARGDLVVLALEHGYFAEAHGLERYRSYILAQVLLCFPGAIAYVSPSDMSVLMDEGFLILRDMVRDAWRRIGERALKLGMRSVGAPDRGAGEGGPARHRLGAFSPSKLLAASERHLEGTVAKLNAFAGACECRGVEVCFFHGPYPLEYHERNREFLGRLERVLAERCQMPVLCVPAETMYPGNQFLDTEYHPDPLLVKQRHTALFLGRLNRAGCGRAVSGPVAAGAAPGGGRVAGEQSRP